MEHEKMNHRVLWSNIQACLDSRHERWRKRVDTFGQVRAVQDRSEGRVWSDNQVFEAVLLAVLSSNTVWSKVEGVLPDLSELFDNFSLETYAGHSDTQIDNRFVPWFMGRKAGSMSLRGGLVHLTRAARILLRHSKRHGSADDYFTSLVHECDDDPKQAAVRLGSQGEHKLPSLGVALAAEALKNLGFDVAKPDRHMMRAVGSFGLVRFNRWKPADGLWGSPKSQSGKKLLEVMTIAEQVADAAEQHAAYVDNAIWLLCARDEVHLTNEQLAGIAKKAGLPNVPAAGLGDVRGPGGKTQGDRMATIRFFREVDGNIRELPEGGAFPNERELQNFFEKHLRTLMGVEFLASEYPAGVGQGRRIGTLGIDGASRPVAVEYKRRRNENFINQGLDHIAWLEDHQAEFRKLVREKLGVGRSTDIDFGHLACFVSPASFHVRTGSPQRPAADVSNFCAIGVTATPMWPWSGCTAARGSTRHRTQPGLLAAPPARNALRLRRARRDPPLPAPVRIPTTPSTRSGARLARNPGLCSAGSRGWWNSWAVCERTQPQL